MFSATIVADINCTFYKPSLQKNVRLFSAFAGFTALFLIVGHDRFAIIYTRNWHEFSVNLSHR